MVDAFPSTFSWQGTLRMPSMPTLITCPELFNNIIKVVGSNEIHTFIGTSSKHQQFSSITFLSIHVITYKVYYDWYKQLSSGQFLSYVMNNKVI